jgi:hypothetical protein
VRIGVLAPLVVVTSLAWSGAAHAAVRCVGTTGADCTTTHATTTDAVNAAVTGVDTIRFGVGTFGPVATPKVLTYVGAGAGTPDSAAGATVIQQTTPSEQGMDLPQGGTVRALRVQGGPSSGMNSAGGGIQFAPTIDGDMALTLIDVIATGGATAPPATPGGAGLALGGSLTATGSKVATVSGGAFLGSSTPGGGGLGLYTCCIRSNITGALIRTAGGPGVYASIGSTLTLEASTVEGTQAIQTQAPNSLTVSRSRVTGVSTGMSIGSDLSAPTPVVVRDSLVTTGATDAVAAVQIQGDNGFPVVFDAVGSTFVGRGNSQAAVLARRTSDMSPALTVTLRNSVARAESSTGFDLLADRATIGVDFSSFNTRSLTNGGLAAEPGSAGNVAGDPLLAADYSLQSGSPLVDRGDPSALLPGELDLLGATRSVDGNGDCAAAPDIGAFERPDACPAASPSPAPSPNLAPALTNVGVTNKVFAPVGKVGATRVKRGTRFRYTLSEPARVRIRIERVLPGRVRVRGTRRTCVKPTARNRRARRCKRYRRVTTLVAEERAGRQSTAFTGRVRGRALRRGAYRARLVAFDALGARSRETRIALRIVRP